MADRPRKTIIVKKNQDENVDAHNFRSPDIIKEDLELLKIQHQTRVLELEKLKGTKKQIQAENKLYREQKNILESELHDAKKRVREQKEIAKKQKEVQDEIDKEFKEFGKLVKGLIKTLKAEKDAKDKAIKAKEEAERKVREAEKKVREAERKAREKAQEKEKQAQDKRIEDWVKFYNKFKQKQAKATQDAQDKIFRDRINAWKQFYSDFKKQQAQAQKAQQQAQKAQQQAQKAQQQSINRINQKQKSSRRRMWNQLNQDFPDSRIARALYRQYVDKTGHMSAEGKFVAGALQTQDRFIKKLVHSLGQLPVFQTMKKGLQQLAGITFLKGASDIAHGNIIGGLGEMLLSGLLFAIPPLVGSLAQTLLPILGKHVIGIVQRASIPILSMLFTGLPKVLGNIFRVVRGLSAVYGLPKLGFGAYAAGSNIGKFTATMGIPNPAVGIGAMGMRILGGGAMLAGGIGGMQLMGKADSSSKGGHPIWAMVQRILGIITMIAPLFGPIGAAVGTIAFLVGNIDTMFNWVRNGINFVLNILKSWFHHDTNQNPPSSTYNNSSTFTNQKTIGNMSTFTSKDGTWNYYRFGNSASQLGQNRWIGLDSSQFSQATLNQYAREGKYNLETLQGGNGIQIANTFYNDAKAGRKGSSLLLQAAAASMKQKGYGDLIITSALASATSGHAKGPYGHSGGQTFDFSAAGLSGDKAIQYASDLYSTGLFSHAQAEYDKKTGEWHIDARLRDEAYELLNQQTSAVKDSNKTINQMVAEQKKQQPGQEEFNDVVSNSLSLSKGIFEKANLR